MSSCSKKNDFDWSLVVSTTSINLACTLTFRLSSCLHATKQALVGHMTNRPRGPLRSFARPLLQMQTGFHASMFARPDSRHPGYAEEPDFRTLDRISALMPRTLGGISLLPPRGCRLSKPSVAGLSTKMRVSGGPGVFFHLGR
jgi:hypothetical protein